MNPPPLPRTFEKWGKLPLYETAGGYKDKSNGPGAHFRLKGAIRLEPDETLNSWGKTGYQLHIVHADNTESYGATLNLRSGQSRDGRTDDTTRLEEILRQAFKEQNGPVGSLLQGVVGVALRKRDTSLWNISVHYLQIPDAGQTREYIIAESKVICSRLIELAR